MKRIFSPAKPLQALPISLTVALTIALPLLGLSAPALALDMQRDDVQSFVDQLVNEHGLDRGYVSGVLADSKTQQTILDAMSRPAERVKPWHEYRAIFLTPKRIAAGVEFYSQHRERLESIQAETGVPPEMILGIVGVESFFGRITGRHRVVDALATLGFDYPPRAKFFRSEFQQVFLLAREEQLDLETLVGSYAGAMGPPQFIPSSYRAYAVDGDGDGQRDLINNWDDVLASVGNYFAAHKWKAGEPVAAVATLSDRADEPSLQTTLKPASSIDQLSEAGVLFVTELDGDSAAGLWRLDGESGNEYWVGFHNLYVITRYNRSVMYALATWQLGREIIRAAKLTGSDTAENDS
jgi:membrane-bound lytic murein transglycosylase B